LTKVCNIFLPFRPAASKRIFTSFFYFRIQVATLAFGGLNERTLALKP